MKVVLLLIGKGTRVEVKVKMNEFEKEAIALRNQGKTLPAGVQENFENADKNGDFKWFTANWRQHRTVF